MTERPDPPLKLAHAGATHIGRVRENNEDAVALRGDLRLFVLADGAGGHNAGNVASALAVSTIVGHFEATERDALGKPEVDAFGLSTSARRLAAAVQHANREIVDIAQASSKRSGMGTTVVALIFSPTAPRLHIAHLGDSRCYRLRGGHLEQMTEDHSFRQDVLEMRPELPDETLRKLPLRVVTRGLGLEAAARVALRSLDIVAGDTFLLCSDGLSGEVPRQQIAEILAFPTTPQIRVELLIEAANEAGGRDNIAAVIVVCEEVPSVIEDRHPSAPAKAGPTLMPAYRASDPELFLVSMDTEPDLDGPA